MFVNKDDVDYGREDDYRLRFFPPDELEIIRSAQHFGVEYQDYRPQPEFYYLKEGCLNLEDMGLTDRQLIAVALVFNGGIKKSCCAHHENQQPSPLRSHQSRPQKNEPCFRVSKDFANWHSLR
jgi:hypothetical protein